MASRFVDLELGGNTWRLPATYAVSKQISETVGDPLKMAVAAGHGQLPWTLENAIDILHVGLKAAGCKLTRQQVGEAIHDAGPIPYMKDVARYVAALVEGSPERALLPSEEDARPKD